MFPIWEQGFSEWSQQSPLRPLLVARPRLHPARLFYRADQRRQLGLDAPEKLGQRNELQRREAPEFGFDHVLRFGGVAQCIFGVLQCARDGLKFALRKASELSNRAETSISAFRATAAVAARYVPIVQAPLATL